MLQCACISAVLRPIRCADRCSARRDREALFIAPLQRVGVIALQNTSTVPHHLRSHSPLYPTPRLSCTPLRTLAVTCDHRLFRSFPALSSQLSARRAPPWSRWRCSPPWCPPRG